MWKTEGIPPQRSMKSSASSGDVIVGRIGVPYKDRGVSVIGLIVEASTDQLGAMTGKLGMLPKVKVKSILV